MGIFDRFPYSSTHEMNLDFMLGKATEIAEDMQTVTAGMAQVQAGLSAISEKTEQATQAAAQAAQSASSIEGSVTAAEEAAEEAQMHNESAQTWANNAMTYKADCQRSATEAAASATSAAQAATAAAGSEDTVAQYAQAANASAQSAANNNDSAHQYANQASASASNATFHSSNAQTAATNAQTAATNAQTAADRAASLKTDVETLHRMCTASVDQAATEAVNAANSAAQAAATKTDVETLVESLPEDFTDLNNTVNQLSDEIATKANLVTGKNKFNKNTSNRKDNVIVGTNGALSENVSYIGFFMPISGGVSVVCNYPYIYFGFCTSDNDISSMAYGDILQGWISRAVPSTVGEVINVPSNALYMFVAMQSNRIDTMQIEIGTVISAYEPYRVGIAENEILWYQTKRTVGAGYAYTTIQDAINVANNGDIIEIMPGTYNEAVTIPGATGDVHTSTKDINIKGFNRDECILTHDIGDYYNPPLEIASGLIENVTIIGTGTTLTDGSNQFAYCVHIDYNSAENKSLQFKNCRFINTVYPCVGVGMRNGLKLSFVDCIFECDTSAAFLMHEQQASDKTDQSIQFENCTFISNASGDGTIHVQESDGYTGNNVTLTFARCIIKNTNSGPLAKLYIIGQTEGERTGWLNSKIYHLSVGSALNSDTLFND